MMELPARPFTGAAGWMAAKVAREAMVDETVLSLLRF